MGTTENAVSTRGSEQSRPGEAVYVVQVKITYENGDGHVVEAWEDVATVWVPTKTRTKTVLRQGLQQAGIDVTTDLQARCLDAGSAYVWSGRPKQDPALELS
jgi:hypothetical protein